MSKSYTGTVSHGTMRAQDLIPAFLLELESRDEAAYAAFVEEFKVEIELSERQQDEWFDGEQANDLLIGLFDALDDQAPDGYYFGAHPGDGSDYGYWPVEREPEEDDE